MKLDLNKVRDWVNEGNKRRSATIKVDRMYGKETEVKAWVYDYDLMIGTYVYSTEALEKLNLEEIKREQDKQQLEKLARELGVEIQG